MVANADNIAQTFTETEGAHRRRLLDPWRGILQGNVAGPVPTWRLTFRRGIARGTGGFACVRSLVHLPDAGCGIRYG